MRKKTVHGTCVALGDAGALLRGSCGSGKSDLALRFLYLPRDRLGAEPALIADDQVILRRDGDRILASCPEALDGKIEVRGCGIAHLKAGAREADAQACRRSRLDRRQAAFSGEDGVGGRAGRACPAHHPRSFRALSPDQAGSGDPRLFWRVGGLTHSHHEGAYIELER